MSRWDHVRAAFVAFHLGAVLVLSFPAPVGGMTRANFEAPASQALFRQLSAALGGVGLARSPAQVEALAWTWGTRFMAARNAAAAPFTPYAQAVGARQGWRMFWSVNRRPARLVVEVEEAGQWRELYRARSSTATWARVRFDHERFRGVVNAFSWLRDRGAWRHFSRWVAVQVARDLPQATRARVFMEQRPTPAPEALRRGELGEAKRRWEQTFTLQELR